jgi:thiol:disulfide interchange protein DsbC
MGRTMNTRLRINLLLAALAVACLPAVAMESGAGAARIDALKANLQARFPDAKIESISPSPIPGVYEVVSPSIIVYSDISGEYVLMGPMIESRSGWNMTEERLGELHAIDYDALPFDRAIRIVKGNGRRRMAVFADPFCPFCKELEHALEQVTDVTIEVFLLPLEGLHPGATQKARDIWCSADPAKSWIGTLLHQEPVATSGSGCESDPVAHIQQLARELRINSTPTVVFGNGTRMDGALSAGQLERLLDKTVATPATPH